MFTILYTRAWEILAHNRRAYMVINIVFYGLVVVFMIYAAFNQPLQGVVLKAANDQFASGALGLLGKGLEAGQVVRAFADEYLGNLLGGSFGLISFPSFVIPFAGLLTGAERAFEMGLTYSPADPDIRGAMLLHWPVLVLEGQAYILAILGAYVHGRAVIWPQTVGLTSRWSAYVEGVRQTGTLYMLIMVVLLIAALYGLLEYAVLSQFLP